ncbi:hypothetical protein LUZ60_012356 [Juncus effusus]|nr:hypothetical protein LUZ60_012356 [Juncus effusus]
MTVAIKKLNRSNMEAVSQFQQEAFILSQIRHPHLVTGLIGSCSEASALVFEFLPKSLEDRLICTDNTPPITWQVRTRIIGEICLALIFLHSCNPHLVIHGNLNPPNVLLDANFVSKLSDFSNCRLVKQSDTNKTAIYHTNYPTGTFAYSDPEYMITGELTPKSNIYSLGIVILHIVTGTVSLGIVERVEESFKCGLFHSTIDGSAGDWPFDQAKRSSRPDLVTGVWPVIEPLMKEASLTTKDAMKDPHLTA